MSNESSTIVQRLWNYCSVLRDDGVSYGDYVEHLRYITVTSLRNWAKARECWVSYSGNHRIRFKAMVDVIKPQPGAKICDPACGTGGFILASHDYISKHFSLDIEHKKVPLLLLMPLPLIPESDLMSCSPIRLLVKKAAIP